MKDSTVFYCTSHNGYDKTSLNRSQHMTSHKGIVSPYNEVSAERETIGIYNVKVL